MRPGRLLGRALLAPALAGGSLLAQTLVVSPPDGLLDDPITVRARGLSPGQPVVLRSKLKDAEGREWQAWAGYVADAEGVVDTAARAPEQGSFLEKGAEGLLSSMDLPGESHGRSRFALSGIEPLVLTITLESGGKSVAEASVVRRFRAADAKAIEIRDGRLVGTFFAPAGRGPFPGVIVLGGSEGGMSSEPGAALLSARGFATLALGYFGLPGLPAELEEIPLEYFERAIEWMRGRPEVASAGVALMGTSKGAEAALLVAAGSSRVVAVVAYAPSSVAWSCICAHPQRPSWTRGGRPVPFVPPASNPIYAPPKGFPIEPAIHYLHRLTHADGKEATAIPVEGISGPVLLVVGEDDRLWPSAYFAFRLRERLSRRARPREDRFLQYEEAGHFVGLPNLPAGGTIVGGRLRTGGTPAANARASRDSWPKVLGFLRDVFR